MNTMIKIAGVFTLALGLAACGSSSSSSGSSSSAPSSASSSSAPATELGSVVDVAVANGGFTTLVAALEATGLDTVLDDPEGNFTVFAPTDAAFDVLGSETITALLGDTETLSNILLYHVITDAQINAETAVAAAGTTVAMANGDRVGLSLSEAGLLVNLSLVVLADVEADNGIIHVIDAVLMPPAERGEPTLTIAEIAQGEEDLSTLVAALQAADLVGVLDDPEATFTVFAPTNAAFEAVGEANLNALLADTEALSAVLLQHVIGEAEVSAVDAYAANGTTVTMANEAELAVTITSGENGRVLRVGGAQVVIADIYATNGVVHVIDTVIVGDLELPAPPQSLVDIAVANGNFETLVAALQATGLDEALADLDSHFTVFAPTDAAFADLPEGTVAALLDDLPALSNILLYHVLAGEPVLADAAIAIAAGEDSLVTTMNDQQIALSLSGSTLQINLSAVTLANVMAANGVIHVIDKVLLPPAEPTVTTDTIADVVVASEDFSTLLAAVQAANLVDALSDTSATYTVFAPTNAAFDKIPEEDLNALLADNEALTQVLLTHVFNGAAISSLQAFAANGGSLTMMSDASVGIEIVDGQLVVGGSVVEVFDIYTANGVIHVIDTVILP